MTCNRSTIRLARGATLARTYRYGAEPIVYKEIGAKTADTPLTITVAAHGLPAFWQVWLLDIGYTKLQPQTWPPFDSDADEPVLLEDIGVLDATTVDADTLTFNAIDLDQFSDGSWADGKLAYLTPVDLGGASAQLIIYDWSGVAVFTIDGDLDNVAKTIDFAMTTIQSATLTADGYTFAVQFTDAAGAVTMLEQGDLLTYPPGSPPQ